MPQKSPILIFKAPFSKSLRAVDSRPQHSGILLSGLGLGFYGLGLGFYGIGLSGLGFGVEGLGTLKTL